VFCFRFCGFFCFLLCCVSVSLYCRRLFLFFLLAFGCWFVVWVFLHGCPVFFVAICVGLCGFFLLWLRFGLFVIAWAFSFRWCFLFLVWWFWRGLFCCLLVLSVVVSVFVVFGLGFFGLGDFYCLLVVVLCGCCLLVVLLVLGVAWLVFVGWFFFCFFFFCFFGSFFVLCFLCFFWMWVSFLWRWCCGFGFPGCVFAVVFCICV